MKRFRFALRPVALLRGHEEMRAQESFAASVQGMLRARRALEDATTRVSELGDQLSDARAAAFPASLAAAALACYRRECANEAAARQALAEADLVMRQRRAEYVDAHRKVEVLGRLERNARLRHRAELQREEQAAYDERASRRPTLPWQQDDACSARI